MISFITIPDASEVLTNIGVWSGAWFSDWLPIALMFIGILLGGIFASAIISIVVGAFEGFFYHKNDNEEPQAMVVASKYENIKLIRKF